MSETRISTNADTFTESNLPLDGTRSTIKSMVFMKHRLKTGKPDRTYLQVVFTVANGKDKIEYLSTGGDQEKAEPFNPTSNGGAYLIRNPAYTGEQRPLNKQSKAGAFIASLQEKMPDLKAILDEDIRKGAGLEVSTELKEQPGIKGPDGKPGKPYHNVIVSQVHGYNATAKQAAVTEDPEFTEKVRDAVTEIVKTKKGSVSVGSLAGAIFNGTWFVDSKEKTAASTLVTRPDFLAAIPGHTVEAGMLKQATA